MNALRNLRNLGHLRGRRVVRAILSLILCGLVAIAAPTATAAPDTEARVSIAVGYAGSTVGVDTNRDDEDSLTPDGWGVRGRLNLSDRWGVQVRCSATEDEWREGSLQVDRLDLLALRQWVFHDGRHRIYGSFGLTGLSLEEHVSQVGRVEDDAVGGAVGLGWEWGKTRWAFSVDFALTVSDVESGAGDESWVIGTTITGFTYRF